VSLSIALIIVIKFLGGGYVQQALVSLSIGNRPLCPEDKSTHTPLRQTKLTTVFGLEVERGCKITKVAAENLDVAMIKICHLDDLDIFVGGVGDINVTCPDKDKEVLFVRFSPLLCFCFWLGWHGGGMELWTVVCAVVVEGGCGGVVWR
jgi:hypothetical protein